MEIESWINNLKVKNSPDEWEVKNLFRMFNIETPKGVLLKTGEMYKKGQLQEPLVVKVCDSKILHKSDIGGVKLKVGSNIDQVIEEMKEKFPDSNLLIEEMAPYSGVEFIIGALVDPTFGPALMVGAGGILTELYKDVNFRLAPFTRNEAVRMLKELTISDILTGYRGSKLDILSLADLLVSVGKLVVALGDNFNQLDINPVVYSNNSWIALDGMAILN